jgi:Secretion system C-terminal sorting domain
MVKIFFSSILLLFSLGGLSAQTVIKKWEVHPNVELLKSFNKDTLKILAVMVSFQKDKDESTFGDGKFGSIYSQDYGSSIIDPLPHNRDYFEEHLEFVKNYFKKVSDGKLNIEYYVLPDTFSVSQTMRNYSPPNGSDDFNSLGNFSKEVWSDAGQLYPNFNFQNYDIFLIFHAGVGRDISLPGSIGDEKDIPSVFLSDNALKKIYGNSFSGFPIGNSGFDITNTMIIPETESRELEDVTGISLVQVSINGLLVSSVASYLGLPDLFDTKTGLTAIGRFGLMDGQAIFAYNGLFPPEPSAWEKIFLGWAEPKIVSSGNSKVDLVADLAASGNDTTILEVPINSSEYFLLENRERDVNHDGAKITYVSNGDTLTKVFTKDTTGFLSYDTDSLKGVVTDVDEFDWALPGSGVVIWHIDNSIINAEIDSNQINADPNNKGVYVEEADGIQDIGQEFTDVLGDVVVAEGDQEDMWYAGNPSKYFQNRFSDDTKPSSNSNSGANSLITISNFSSIANKMSFNVDIGDSIATPVFHNQLSQNANYSYLTVIPGNNSYELGIGHDSSLSIYNSNGILVKNIDRFSKVKAASIFEGDSLYVFGVLNQNLSVYIKASNIDTTFYFNFPVNTNYLNENFKNAAPVVVENPGGGFRLLVGSTDGNVYAFTNSLLSSSTKNLPLYLSGQSGTIVQNIAAAQNYVSFVSENPVSAEPVKALSKKNSSLEMYFQDNQSHSLNLSGSINELALTKTNDGTFASIMLINSSQFDIIENGTVVKQFGFNGQINSFSLADLKKDGNNYILFCMNSELYAVSLQGVLADNFPVSDPQGIGFTSTPLSANFTGDSKPEIIAFTTDGRIFAIDGSSGKTINGFPISAGNNFSSTPSLTLNNGNLNLSVLTSSNDFYSWNISSMNPTLFWSEESGNNYSNSFLNQASSNNVITNFLPSDQAYNYPNPVYGNETNIHYYVSEDSKIDIKIFDLAGDLVAQLNYNAKGGFANETVWNVSNIQSGVYLARIEAQGSSGKTESKIIKIAVIK